MKAAWLIAPAAKCPRSEQPGACRYVPYKTCTLLRTRVMVNGPAWKALIEEEFGDGNHVGIGFRHDDRAPAGPEGRPRKDRLVGQVPAVQILRFDRQQQAYGH